jgi:hypothetical protein
VPWSAISAPSPALTLVIKVTNGVRKDRWRSGRGQMGAPPGTALTSGSALVDRRGGVVPAPLRCGAPPVVAVLGRSSFQCGRDDHHLSQEPTMFSTALAQQLVSTVTENNRRRSRVARLRAHRA